MASSLYGSRWQRARLVFLAENPLCRYCEREGRVTPATVVDPIEAHKGSLALFWDVDNWQSLCRDCHDTVKRSEERGTVLRSGCDADGMPLGATHPWNRPAK